MVHVFHIVCQEGHLDPQNGGPALIKGTDLWRTTN